jgi:putative lipoic acid-binding regulatory protein
MEPERITFPTEYPIKVVVRASPEVRQLVDSVFSHHFGAISPENVTERASAQSNFLALTYVVIAQNEGQLASLHVDLKLLDGVMMVL